jgi:proteic killer suppression protein
VLRNTLHYQYDQVIQTQRSLKKFESGITKGIQAALSNKLRMQLAVLSTATNIDDIDIPGYQFH